MAFKKTSSKKITSSSRRETLQLFLWGGIAALSLAYLFSFLMVSGAYDNGVDGGSSLAELAKNKRNNSPENTRGLKALTKAVNGVRAEITALRTHVKTLDNREQKLADSLGALKKALGPTTASLQSRTGSDGSLRPVNAFEEQKKLPTISVQYLPMPNKESAKRLPATKRMNKKTASLDAPDRKSLQSTRTRFAVHLSSARTIGTLKRQWTRFTQTHQPLAGKLQARVIRKHSSDIRQFDLVAGPFDNAADAARLCARLKSDNLFCKETVFEGERL